MVRLGMGRSRNRFDRRDRLDSRGRLDRAGHPLPPRRGFREWGEDDLLDRPQRDVVEANQGARRLDLGIDEGEAPAAVAQNAKAALAGPVADLGK